MKKSKKGDKPLMDTRIDEFASERFPEKDKKNLIYMGDTKLVGVESSKEQEAKDALQSMGVNREYWDKHREEVEKYNEELYNLDPDYAAFVPHKELLVRAFFKDYVEIEGMLIPPKVNQMVRTQSGIGFLEPEESPFCFKNLVIVVAVPEGYDKYKPGDVLQVAWGLVLPIPKQKNETNENVLPNAFTLYNHQQVKPPENIKDKHFGYFMADPYQAVIGRVPDLEKH